MEVAKASHVTAAVRKATSPETAQVVVVAEVEEVDMAAEGPTCAEISRRATVAMVTDADSSTERMMTEGKAAGEEVEEECADSTKVDTAPTEIVADSPTVMEATQAEETEAEVDVEEVMSATTAAKLAISQETAPRMMVVMIGVEAVAEVEEVKNATSVGEWVTSHISAETTITAAIGKVVTEREASATSTRRETAAMVIVVGLSMRVAVRVEAHEADQGQEIDRECGG